jgi:hypothetical protein
MGVEVGNALLGIEFHRLFEIAHRAPSSMLPLQRTRGLRLRGTAPVPTPTP